MVEPKNNSRNREKKKREKKKKKNTGKSRDQAKKKKDGAGPYPPGVDNVNEVYYESYIVPGASSCLRGGASTSIW